MSKRTVEELELLLQSKEKELARYNNEISKLNSHLKDLIGQINQEIKMSALIQKVLVPTEIPSIPGFDFSTKFVPSLIAGGDYFDLFEHEDKFRFGLVLSCASGYGMSALFLSVLMKMTSQIGARKYTEPHVSMQNIVKELLPSLQENDHSDIFFGVVDRRTLELIYCMAGDLCVLHLNASEEKVTLLDDHAGRLQKDFKGNLISQKVMLNPKDRLVLASKGAFEAKSPNGELFGAERIKEIVESQAQKSVHDCRNEILFQIERWTQKNEPDRDLTVIVVEVKERVLKLARS